MTTASTSLIRAACGSRSTPGTPAWRPPLGPVAVRVGDGHDPPFLGQVHQLPAAASHADVAHADAVVGSQGTGRHEVRQMPALRRPPENARREIVRSWTMVFSSVGALCLSIGDGGITHHYRPGFHAAGTRRVRKDAARGVGPPTNRRDLPVGRARWLGTGESITVGIDCHPERSEGSPWIRARSFAALRMTVIDSPILGCGGLGEQPVEFQLEPGQDPGAHRASGPGRG